MTASLRGPLLLVGGGKMGGAILQGWLERGLPAAEAVVVEPEAGARGRLAAMGVTAGASAADLRDMRPRAILLAVKPQVMDAVLPDYRSLVSSETLVMSIAAGKPVSAFEAAFGTDKAIVRVMPNTPAAIGQGMSVLFANNAVTASQKALAESLMAAVGRTAWIDDESLMHAVTGLSGSGPAYVFHMCEALTGAGIAAGLPAELATLLARQTMAGSGALLAASDETAEQLRINVTSPGGTTQAGLQVLMGDDALARLIRETVAAAARRSVEFA